jgi:hypothetical protein
VAADTEISGPPVKNGFDPELIPGKPDPTTQPALSKAWERMFELPFEWVEPELCNLNARHALIPTPEVHQFLEAATTRYENSRDWCGASIVPDGGNQFVQIYGEWKVPEASVPRDGTPGTKYYSAAWIGLDGDRRYLDSSMPQVGTQQNTPGDGGPVKLPYYAWFQWWAPRRISADLWWITGIPIKAGDYVMGLIWAINTTHVAVVFRNFASNKITSFCMEAPTYFRDRGWTQKYQPTISGATAEWIVEDPTTEIEPTLDSPFPPDLEPFADYKSVTFCHCVAGMAETPGQSTSEKVLTSPRFKRMYRVSREPPLRTRFISMPKRGASDTDLVVEYGGFKSK